MTIDAKSYFEECLAKVRKTADTEARYAELMESGGAIRYDGAGGGTGDPMARIDAAMDYLQIVRERRAELAETLDRAMSILYGVDGRGGLAKLKGPVYADSICMHYLQGASWSDIAGQSEIYSSKQLRNYAMSGFRFIDRHGFAYVKEGGKKA